MTKYKDFQPPAYWSIPAVAKKERLQSVTPCSKEELDTIQNLLDTTHKRICARNRCHVPYRLEIVHAFRSENIPLTHRFNERKAKYKKGACKIPPKTSTAKCLLNTRLEPGEGLLFHGTNPSS